MEQRIIRAAIVDHERSRVIVDANGELPYAVFDSEAHGTTERVLDRIGQDVFENVRYISPDYGFGHDGELHYQTKPVPESAKPSNGYEWCEPVQRTEADDALTLAQLHAKAAADWKAGLSGVLPVRMNPRNHE